MVRGWCGDGAVMMQRWCSDDAVMVPLNLMNAIAPAVRGDGAVMVR